MNMLYLLLLTAALYALRRTGSRRPAWLSNSLAGSAILLAAVFIGRNFFRAASPAEMSAAILCLAGVAAAEAYWLSTEEIR